MCVCVWGGATSQQVYDRVSEAEGDRLGAGDAGAATRHVLCRHAEQAAVFPGQHVLAVTQERVAVAVKRHVVWISGDNAHTGTDGLGAVPAPLLTHTAGGEKTHTKNFVWWSYRVGMPTHSCGCYHVLQSLVMVSLA